MFIITKQYDINNCFLWRAKLLDMANRFQFKYNKHQSNAYCILIQYAKRVFCAYRIAYNAVLTLNIIINKIYKKNLYLPYKNLLVNIDRTQFIPIPEYH